MRPWILVTALCLGCGSGGGSEADDVGVGAECADSDDCPSPDTDIGDLECLTQFAGGYCGLEGCEVNEDCPEGSACVIHDDGNNYCFLECFDKEECNLNRSADTESNCSSNIVYADAETEGKACVPPSSGR